MLHRRIAARALREIGRRVPSAADAAIRVAPRPWDDPLMELTSGAWYGMFAFEDVDGRMLGEANTVPLWLRRTLPDHEWKTARYEGSRAGRPFNIAALRQVTSSWKTVLTNVATLRAAYVDAAGVDGELAPLDLHGLARTVTSLPAFLARGSTAMRSGMLPAEHAAAFKVMAGIHMTIDDLLRLGEDLERSWTADELFEHIERRGLFLSAERNACGGPKHMVLELLELAIHGGTPGTPLPRQRRVLDYGRANAAIELILGRREVALRGLLDRPLGPDRAYAVACARLGIHLDIPTTWNASSYGGFERSVLAALTPPLATIGSALEREPRPPTRRALYRRDVDVWKMLVRKRWISAAVRGALT